MNKQDAIKEYEVLQFRLAQLVTKETLDELTVGEIYDLEFIRDRMWYLRNEVIDKGW